MTRHRVLATAVLAACLLTSLTYPAQAFAVTVGTTEFASRVDSAASALAGASVGTTAGALAAADAVDGQLPSDLAVIEGTRTIVVGPATVAGLTNGLREAGTAEARRKVADQLSARLASVRAALGSPHANPSDPVALKELLASRPRTALSGQNQLNDRLAKFLDDVARWIASLFPRGQGVTPQGPGRWVLVLVLLVPVLLALVVLLRAWRTRRQPPNAAALSGPAGVHGPVVAAAADLPPDAAAYADELASGGQYRDAVRALYGGAARHLAETGAVRRMRTRTNLEMLRDVRTAAPAIAPTFGELTRRFEAVWYGHADPGNAGYVDARSAYERVVSATAPAAPERPGTAPAASTGPARDAAPEAEVPR